MFQIEAPWSQIRPLFRYFNEAFACKCFPDLLEMGMFPNAKELTESFAAYNVVRRGSLKGQLPLSDPSMNCVVVGDGNTPRTAAVFAMRTAWTVHSVDPRLKPDVTWPVKRLIIHRCKIEDASLPEFTSKVLIVAIHSHADLTIAVSNIIAPSRTVIAIPCCVPQILWKEPDLEYFDRGIWSPANKVKVWLDV